MARAANKPKRIELHGPPRALRPRDLIDDLPGRGRVLLPSSLAGAGPNIIEFSDARRLRVGLPRDTRPGQYEAKLEVGERTLPLSLNVAPYESLKATPSGLIFEGSPGGPAETAFSLQNRGNVASEIPERCTYWLFDVQGLEHAVIDTLHEKTDDPQQLVGTLLARLHKATGGQSKVRITSGAGPLAVGQERTVGLRAYLPSRLHAGRSYVGLMTLGPMHQGIRVNAVKEKRGSGK